MLPPHILKHLTPPAALAYLALLSLRDPWYPSKPIPVSRDQLCAITGLSPRTCERALHSLRKLHIISLVKRRYHAPNIYRLHPPHEIPNPSKPANPPPAADVRKTNPPPRTPFPPQNSPPSQNIPAPAPKIPNPPPMADLLNKLGASKPATSGGSLPPQSRSPLDPAQLLRLLDSLPLEKTLALYKLSQTLSAGKGASP